MKHGASAYRQNKCHCDICTAANAEQTRKDRTRRKQWLRTGSNGRPYCFNPVVEHGLSGTYANWGCRCDSCTQARALDQGAIRELRLSQRVIGPNGRWFAPNPRLKHGGSSTYSNWGCRCDPCLQAHMMRMKLYRRSA